MLVKFERGSDCFRVHVVHCKVELVEKCTAEAGWVGLVRKAVGNDLCRVCFGMNDNWKQSCQMFGGFLRMCGGRHWCWSR